MSDLENMITAFQKGRAEYEQRKNGTLQGSFEVREIYGADDAQAHKAGRIILGNNLDYMDHICKNDKLGRGLQLIYVDPPFFSKSKYQASVVLQSEILGNSSTVKIDAYDDFRASALESYLQMLTTRLFFMRDLLSDTGCIAVHLDWHVAHYVKILMDEIFGRKNFINEIIWNYKSGGTSKKNFARKHDTLLLYGKTKQYKFHMLKEKSYNRGMKPYCFQGVEEFQDEQGWYTMVNMKDVWTIDMVGRTSAERTGYATQKPEKLLERIVEACSDPGDLCADFFAGSGSFGAVCAKMGRNWIMCDESPLAISSEIARLTALQKRAGEKEDRMAGGFSVLAAKCGTAAKSELAAKSEPDVRNAAKIFAEVSEDQVLLTGYEPPGTVENCSSPEEVERFVRGDSLSLVAVWSVDFAWNGIVHRADKILCSGERSAQIPKGAERIHIAGYDVFGNCFAVFFER